MFFIFREKLEISAATKQLADEHDFEVKGYVFRARKEDVRQPRIVRVSVEDSFQRERVFFSNALSISRLVPSKTQLCYLPLHQFTNNVMRSIKKL
jgi:hypothetical protein